MWGIGVYGRALRPFRILFITIGFLFFAVAMAITGVIFSAYTVPVGTGTPYYTQTSVNGLSTICYAMEYVFSVAGIFYLAIELILYAKGVIELGNVKRHNRLDQPYSD